MVCNNDENDAHLFFHCTFARAVWFFAKTPVHFFVTIWTGWVTRNPSAPNKFLHKWWTSSIHFNHTVVHMEGKERSSLQQHLLDHLAGTLCSSSRHTHKLHELAGGPTTATAIQAKQQASHPSFAGNTLPTAGTSEHHDYCDEDDAHQPSVMVLPTPPLYRLRIPALLPGSRCYTDASTPPDSPLQVPRRAGLGVFIIDTQFQPTATIYIKAVLNASTSVLMAEAAAIALAAQVVSALDIRNMSFPTDNQQLVKFLNSNNHDTPPRWDTKFFTQSFINNTRNCDPKMFKVPRNLNTTELVLATQAYCNHTSSSTAQMRFRCTNLCSCKQLPLPGGSELCNAVHMSPWLQPHAANKYAFYQRERERERALSQSITCRSARDLLVSVMTFPEVTFGERLVLLSYNFRSAHILFCLLHMKCS